MSKQIQKTTTPMPSSSGLQGIVISYFGNSVAVEGQDGQVFQCQLRRNQELPVVGDKVVYEIEGNTGLISAILPRQSLLARGDGHDKLKPIAANVDAILIVMAPPPIFSEHLVDRYLVAAELLGIPPVIVMNKTDLMDEQTRQAAEARLEVYRRIPYKVVLSSIFTSGGLGELSKILCNKTAVLVGSSGVGKSSIITALGNNEAIRVGEVSPKGAGKHTTTATRLYHLPNGGQLIDSPGVREFSLWPITQQEVLSGFPEFKPFMSGCRFRDCIHHVEPGCVVQAAVADGRISTQRFTSYHELLKKVIHKR